MFSFSCAARLKYLSATYIIGINHTHFVNTTVQISGIFFSIKLTVSRYEYNCSCYIVNWWRARDKRFLTFLLVSSAHFCSSREQTQSWRHERGSDLTSSDVALICSIHLHGVSLRARYISHDERFNARFVSLRGKRASARLLSSLPHYSIMMACGVCRTPSALPSQASTERALLPSSPPSLPRHRSFLSSLFSLFSLRRSSPASRRLLFSGIFLPHPFSPSHSSVDPSRFMFLQLPSYGEPTERHAYTSL